MVQRFKASRPAFIVFQIWMSVIFALALPFLKWDVRVFCVMAVLVLIPLWTLYGTFYNIGNGLLIARSGPFRAQVRISEIKEIRDISHENSTQSPFARGTQRIAIIYDDGKLVISPEDVRGFVLAIRNINPGVSCIHGEDAR